MTQAQTIHPFPARMAPDIAREALSQVRPGGNIIDPMCGSGTVLRAAVENGLAATGTDVDPLSVLMSRVWTTPVGTYRLEHDGRYLCQLAGDLESDIRVTENQETQDFIDFWFAEPQKTALARLAFLLRGIDWPTKDALTVAFSRIIITKERAASLARDTSHSRPHRVTTSHDYDVYRGFLKSVKLVSERIKDGAPGLRGHAEVHLSDARTLGGCDDDTYDLALTSPPYLNAIDYLRGHRMTLVWLGYDIGQLRETRSNSVGAERSLEEIAGLDIERFITMAENASFGSRHRGWVHRYASDMEKVLGQLQRVTKPGGRVVLVVGNSFIRGAAVDNAGLIRELAGSRGLELIRERQRQIPARRRYLPPPTGGDNSLDSRMRTEVVMTFAA